MSHASAAMVLDNLLKRLADLPEPDKAGARVSTGVIIGSHSWTSGGQST
jgi:hypothetical protein